jgi:hypothetical protein
MTIKEINVAKLGAILQAADGFLQAAQVAFGIKFTNFQLIKSQYVGINFDYALLLSFEKTSNLPELSEIDSFFDLLKISGYENFIAETEIEANFKPQVGIQGNFHIHRITRIAL